MKTASRVVGTAAVLAGFQAQDSPVYGAERRGAPVTAFARIARGPILERGIVPVPDLVVVADDTLLGDPVVQPLAGLPPAGGLVLATAHGEAEVRRHSGHPGPLLARDFLSAALEEVGSAAGVSSALAAAVGALLGLPPDAVDRALAAELAAAGVAAPRLAPNARLAARARVGLDPLTLPVAVPAPAPARGAVVDVAWEGPELGAPTVTAAPNTPERRTGSWRVHRPVIDLARCTRCWVCFVRCPDGAISLDTGQWPHVDYEVCKGCLICGEECPPGAIGRAREPARWVEAEATR